MIVGECYRVIDQQQVLGAIASDPDPEQNLQPGLRGKFGHHVQSVIDRIGADTFGDLGEFAEIFGDLLRTDDQPRIVRRLVATERRVGHTFQLGRRINRRAHQRDRRGQPPPRRSNESDRSKEERKWRAQTFGRAQGCRSCPQACLSMGSRRLREFA